MKFNFEIKGLDKLQKKIKKLERKVKSIEGKRQVKLTELLTDSFIRNNSDYNSIQNMVDSFPREIDSEKDFDSKEWDEFVRTKSKFNSWGKMLQAAHGEWVKKKLDL